MYGSLDVSMRSQTICFICLNWIFVGPCWGEFIADFAVLFATANGALQYPQL